MFRKNRLWLATAFILVTTASGLAAAQFVPFHSPAAGFGIAHPADWQREEMPSAGAFLLGLTSPSGTNLAVVHSSDIPPEELTAYANATRHEISEEIWSGFAPEIPGAQLIGANEFMLAGQDATMMGFAGPGVSGTLVWLMVENRVYTLAFVSFDTDPAPATMLFAEMLGSFTLGGAPQTPGNNQPANPLNPANPANPLVPPQPGGQPQNQPGSRR